MFYEIHEVEPWKIYVSLEFVLPFNPGKVLLSGFRRILQHFGAKMHPSNPALGTKIEKISIPTMAFPLVLLYAGRDAIQTLQNTNVLDVRKLA